MSLSNSECSDTFLSISSSDTSDINDSFHSTEDNSLDKALTSSLVNFPTNFNVAHINCQSIPAHFIDLLASFQSSKLHAILISETWLKPCLSSSSYSLPGFTLIRNDRIGRGGGGVAIYLRNDIPFTIVSTSSQPPPPDEAEHLLIEISLLGSKILLGVCYIPSIHFNYFSSFETILENFCPRYMHVIIMGDFNTCLNKTDSRANKFTTLIEACNLNILPLNSTHVFPGCSPSLLDLIIVSSLQHVSKHGQLPAEAFSYHDLIYLSYLVRPPRVKKRILMQRNFASIDTARLRHDALLSDWSTVILADSIDCKIHNFNSTLTDLFDRHAPIRQIKIKHTSAPWLSDEIKVIMCKKVAAKAKLKVCNSDINRDKYKIIRNRCNMMCRDALRRHIHKSVESGDTCKT